MDSQEVEDVEDSRIKSKLKIRIRKDSKTIVKSLKKSKRPKKSKRVKKPRKSRRKRWSRLRKKGRRKPKTPIALIVVKEIKEEVEEIREAAMADTIEAEGIRLNFFKYAGLTKTFGVLCLQDRL